MTFDEIQNNLYLDKFWRKIAIDDTQQSDLKVLESDQFHTDR